MSREYKDKEFKYKRFKKTITQVSGEIMKKIVISFLALASLSSFASSEQSYMCDYIDPVDNTEKSVFGGEGLMLCSDKHCGSGRVMLFSDGDTHSMWIDDIDLKPYYKVPQIDKTTAPVTESLSIKNEQYNINVTCYRDDGN